MSCKKPTLSPLPIQTVDRGLRILFLSLISFYQRFLSPFLGGHCRFYPSCSNYAREAFTKRSFLPALGLTLKRLAKCQPFHPGGYDPLDEPPPGPRMTPGTPAEPNRAGLDHPCGDTDCDSRIRPAGS